MDRPLANPTNRGWRKYRGTAMQSLAVIAVVFGVASIVPLAMYLLAPRDALRPSARTHAVSRSPAPPDTPPAVAFTAVNIIDVENGVVHEAQTVVVRNGVIDSVGAASSTPAGAMVIDGRGKYLMPGLIDTHVHLTTDEQLLLYVAAGVTTVQSLGDRMQDNRTRAAAVAAGALAGPSVVSCDFVVPGVSVDRVDAVVSEALASGTECIKIYSPPDWTREGHRELVRVARARGLRIGGHLPRNLPLDEALANHQQFIAHAEEFLYAHFFKFPDRFNEARLAEHAVAVRDSGGIVTPTLVAYRAIVDQVGPRLEELLERPELRYVPRDVLETWKPPQNRYRKRFTAADGERLAAAFAFQQKLVRAWNDAGVPLALGTDASPAMPFVVPGFSALDELQELREAGLSPAQVLRASTRESAILAGRPDRGVIAAGRRADLVLLDANPLDDVKNVRRIAGVMTGGRWMAATWIREQLSRRAEAFTALWPERRGAGADVRSSVWVGDAVRWRHGLPRAGPPAPRTIAADAPETIPR